ncbi:hypothetical protein ACQPZF_12875 [Actinosynnema sp. CS-041913]|uniref:hypothetical protein n=1 Tax=Actinosynnema sp. CS-041913 TaxID=3239917 RepID=UPI003D8FDBD8
MAALAAATATAAALSLLSAGSAQATSRECLEYLHDHGYEINAAHATACTKGEKGDYNGCVDGLFKERVRPLDALKACDLAKRTP